MSSGSSNSTLLNMPDYGDGLDEALTAQIGALSGELLSGPLKGTTLQEVMERYERPLRMSAAQIDNDVLRQTLLGGQVPVFKSTSGMNIVERRASQPGEGGQTTQIDYGGVIDQDTGKVIIGDAEIPEAIKDWSALLNNPGTITSSSGQIGGTFGERLVDYVDKHKDWWAKQGTQTINGTTYDFTKNGLSELANAAQLTYGFQGHDKLLSGFDDTISEQFGTPEPIYKKNDDGTDFIVPKDEDGNFILEAGPDTEIPEGGVAATPGELTGYTRAGTGLVDMMGDTRNVMDYSERPDYASYVNNQSDLKSAFNQSKAAGDTRTIEQWGEDHYLSSGRNEGRDLPTTFDASDTGRQAGFDAEGNFLGLAALAEDIQRGNLSRQREADLADVERLSDRYSNVMDQFRPGTQQALTDASAILAAQKDNLTGAGSITTPSDSTYGGDITAGTMTAATVGDPLELSAKTSYAPSVDVTGGTFDVSTNYDPSANVTGGTFNKGTSYTAQGVADPLKLSAATSYDPSAGVEGATYTAAQAGDPMKLTAANSYDPSANVTGGTFDAGTSYTATKVANPMALDAAISYAPSADVKGDGYTATAGLQGGNVGADALRAALLADAEKSLAGGLTDRELANISNAARARSTLSGRTFDQSGAIAEAQALVAEDNNRRMQNRVFAGDTLGRESDIQRADLERGLQASMQNQAALNRAAEFGASQNIQAQLANQAATNQARQAAMTAGLSQEALSAQQAQAKAMADATAANRASEFGVTAGLEQEARRNQAQLQAQLANQSATNQAAQAAMNAGLSQEALAAQQKQAQQFANQAASNRALEFGASTSMDAQRLNQAATNQALSQGLSAGLSQEALSAQQAQAKALADASAINRASEFGIGAGLDQEARANQAALQAALANQQATNQAAQFGVSAGMDQQAQANQAALQAQLANQQAANQALQFGVGADMEQDALRAQLGQQTTLAQAQMDQQAAAFDADAAQRASQLNQAQLQQANQFGVGATMDAQRLNEQLKQAGTLGYIDASTRLAALEDQYSLDPFQALLGRAGGGSLQAGQGVFGQASYGLSSGPNYLNPESGLGFISQMAANNANMYAANQAANASRNAGMMGMFGNIGSGLLGGIF